MKDTHITDENDLSWDDWDELQNPRPDESDFDDVVEQAISRRGFLRGALAFGSGAAVMGTGTLLSSTSARAAASRFAFDPLPIATDFTVHVPQGYKWATMVRYGDPLFSDAPDFSQTTAIPADQADRVFGEDMQRIPGTST